MTEWKDDVDDRVRLKIGARRVMVLRNLYGEMVIDPNKKVDTDAIATQTVLWNEDGSVGITGDEDSKIEVEPNALLQANGDMGAVENIYLSED